MRMLFILFASLTVACNIVTPSQHYPERSRYPSRPDEEADYPETRQPQRDRDREQEVRAPLTPAHPRLIISNDDLARTKQLIQDDPLAGQWFGIIRARADKLLSEQASAANPTNHKDTAMLNVSRTCLSRIGTLAGMYRLSGDRRYAGRAIQEMLAASRMHDWDPSDFLATAEMTNALAIGYDWCYDAMNPDQRERIHSAIVDKGLRPGLSAYQNNDGWTTARHNWNLVCNGGLIVGALAVQDEEARIAKSVLAQARKSIRYGMSAFAPDGGWEEGPTYWAYATRYATFAMAALDTATGSDGGLSQSPGFPNAGMFRIYTTGPTGKPFNFADAEEALGNAPQMMWMASQMLKPVYAAAEVKYFASDPAIFDLLWYRPASMRLIDRLPLAARFRGVEVGAMRGPWNDSDATYLAFKGGSNEAHHGHLDLGTFVLDALGQRWVCALGRDNYDLPDYFGQRRWSYYRASTRGQNTILLDNRNQDLQARATIRTFSPGESRSQAVIDLGQAYEGYAKRAMRGFALIDQRVVLVQDEIDLSDTTDVRSLMHTTADVELTGDGARLRQGGQTMTVQLLEAPKGAKFEVQNVTLAPPQEPAPQGLKKLVIHVPEVRGRVRIAVLFTPGQRPTRDMRVVPLSQWTAGK